MKKLFLSITLIVLTTCSVTFAQSKIKAIKAGKVIDVLSGTVLTNTLTTWTFAKKS